MGKRVIAVVHNVPVPSGHAFSEASLDVLTQVEAVENALIQLGYATVRIAFTRDVSGFIQRIREEKVDMAFNLCETVDENPRFAGHPAAVLELLGISFSGSSSMALMLTTDKILTKRLLIAKGIRTPNYLICNGTLKFNPRILRFPVIVKPRFEDASIGIDQDSIFQDEGEFRKGIGEFFERFGTLLVEEYITGREFNVSLFGYPSPSVLPAAEIDFSGFPKDLYPIVGYRAKWDIGSFEYQNTPRKFLLKLPNAIKKRIENTALESFRILMLKDYGRVDMRLDSRGRVHILEVNANPCLSPDAGFVAAAKKDGMTYSDIVKELVNFIEHRSRNNENKASHIS